MEHANRPAISLSGNINLKSSLIPTDDIYEKCDTVAFMVQRTSVRNVSLQDMKEDNDALWLDANGTGKFEAFSFGDSERADDSAAELKLTAGSQLQR